MEEGEPPKLKNTYSRIGREKTMADLQSGFPLLIQQYKALVTKNIILASRTKKATFLQLFSSAIFMFLLFAIDKSLQAKDAGSPNMGENKNPEPIVAPSIPLCEDKFYIRLPCYDFVWSGNSSTKIQWIVTRIMENNPGRKIPAYKVKSFRTPDEVDTWLFNDPMRCPGALHFVEENATVISYGIQTNSTAVTRRGRNEDPTFKFQIPLQIAAEREIARHLIGDSSFSWLVGFKEFPHPAVDTTSALEAIGPTFFLAIAMFGFVFQIGNLVAEKELKLRQAMSMMGLYETAYWLSWLTWEILFTVVSALLTVLFGMMFNFDFFKYNSFAVLFLTFFLFQLTMIAFAFMISTLLSKASSATTVGFSIFIIGFLTQIVTQAGFPYSSGIGKQYQYIWSCFPPNLLAQAISMLTSATSTSLQKKGISWHSRAKCPPTTSDDGDNCVITIDTIYKWLISTFVGWFILAIYLDNIIPNPSGVRKPLLYFLNPGYWTGNGGNNVEEGGILSCISSVPPLEEVIPDDEDVLEEENLVKHQLKEGVVDPNVAVQIQGLAKIYPGTTRIGCCCTVKRTKPFHAVRGLWVNFAKGQLFCLLGPNGAGKSTSISVLTGITPVTYGDALIYGHSVRSSVGMSNIRKMIGVCPQFDILWDVLSGLEHLHLFGNIKGLPPSSVKSVSENSLSVVKLTPAANIRAGSYSGGMKRRLSVAIALIGDPKLVILDEPTTGMDPITRRHVWDVIEEAKKGRAIVLTTHSMEEADILSDRIAIMAKGRLRCIGTSIRLKSRFGTGFIANVSFHGNTPGEIPYVDGDANATVDPRHEAVKQFFKQKLNVVPKEENKKFLTFIIPHEKEGAMTSFFSELEERQTEFGISDIQLGLTSLEEVFLNIAKQAELESALAEGTFVTLTLTSGASLQIPKGARFIGIPGTETSENPRGVMVEVHWEQSEDGALSISGHSPETPIPPNVQLLGSTSEGSHGFLIDAKDVVGVKNQ